MSEINELIILSAPGVDESSLRDMAMAIEHAGFPHVLITNEEFKVTDLDKLEKQLQSLLQVVQSIKKEKSDIALMERAERIREKANTETVEIRSPYITKEELYELDRLEERPKPPIYKGPKQQDVIDRLMPQRRQLSLDDLIKNVSSKERM